MSTTGIRGDPMSIQSELSFWVKDETGPGKYRSAYLVTPFFHTKVICPKNNCSL